MTSRTAILALAIMTPAIGWAQEPVCYALPDAGAGLSEVTVTRSGEFNFTYPGQPHVVYGMSCGFDDGANSTTCSIDCDGGAITFTLTAQGMQIDAHVRIEQARMESLLIANGPLEASGVYLEGDWLLPPAAPELCEDIETRAQPLMLEPGDVYPAVERLERQLQIGGFFLSGPDMIYDTATADAIRAFQAQAGLPQTGKTDRALLTRIGIEAGYTFGGC